MSEHCIKINHSTDENNREVFNTEKKQKIYILWVNRN